MKEEKLLTIREAASILDVSEKEIMELAERGDIPAYKIAGVYLRFKKEQILDYKKSLKPLWDKAEEQKKYSIQDRISDFFYFNDFYILSALIIMSLLVLIFQGY